MFSGLKKMLALVTVSAYAPVGAIENFIAANLTAFLYRIDSDANGWGKVTQALNNTSTAYENIPFSIGANLCDVSEVIANSSCSNQASITLTPIIANVCGNVTVGLDALGQFLEQFIENVKNQTCNQPTPTHGNAHEMGVDFPWWGWVLAASGFAVLGLTTAGLTSYCRDRGGYQRQA